MALPEESVSCVILNPRFTLNPREVEQYVTTLDPRRELVYRLAFRDLCDRCRGDPPFKERTEALMRRFSGELGALLAEAGELPRELTESDRKAMAEVMTLTIAARRAPGLPISDQVHRRRA